MRLFRRKSPIDDAIRCPECGERLPDGAAECAMCGDRHRTRRGRVADGSARSMVVERSGDRRSAEHERVDEQEHGHDADDDGKAASELGLR
jgi:zinc-ribbon domain